MPCSKRDALDRRRLHLHPAAGGAIGLRDDESDLVAGGDDGFECGNGELGRAAED